MSEQDGAQSPTKQRRSRKTKTANQQNGKQTPAVQRPNNDDTEAWKEYWKAQGQLWRTEPEIDKERQKFLTERRDIKPDIEQGIYPFRGIKLSRADVEWLLATHENGRGAIDWSEESHRRRTGLDLRGTDLSKVDLSDLPLTRVRCGLSRDERFDLNKEEHLEWADLAIVHLEGTDLSYAHLEQAILFRARLEAAILFKAHLEEAYLSESHLEGAYLRQAHLEGGDTNLREAHLEGAILWATYLEGAYLSNTHLEGANLRDAHLEGTALLQTHLEGKCMSANDLERLRKWIEDFPETLPPANLGNVFFDSTTTLKGAILGNEDYGYVLLADAFWGNVNLAVVNWASVKMLGDEYVARQKKHSGKVKDKITRLSEYEVAVRANRQLAVALQAQGLNEDGARFAYRAQMLQRKVFWYQGIHSFGQYLFSLFLDLFTGYGYKPWRSFVAYLIVILGFATAYFVIGHTIGPVLSPLSSFVFSMTSFHGRGFFPGNNISLDDPLTVLAALEAFVGLLIEVTFIATLTQRLFGK